MWSPEHGVPVGAQLGPALVVGHDHDDVVGCLDTRRVGGKTACIHPSVRHVGSSREREP